MPVVKFKPDRLLNALGVGSVEEAGEVLFRLKCEVEENPEGLVEVEVNPDRPDMYMLEGIARAARGILRLESGWEMPRVRDSGITLRAGEAPSRPYIAAAVVYNYRLDEDTLDELIQFQEKLHDTIGRRRRKVAIGIHDLAKLPSREVEYKSQGLDTRMKPLGLDVDVEASWVLENTEQGVKYGGISLEEGRHPFLLAGGQVIAMPPVINSNITRLEPGTRDLFIDVTGTDARTVAKVLDVIVSTLSYRDGVEVGLVRLEGAPWKSTPLLSSIKYNLSPGEVNNVLGTSLTPEEVAEHLSYMRHNARASGATVMVAVPPFRVDILRSVDLAEDVAISIGYEDLGPRLPHFTTRGSLLGETRLSRRLRELLVGLGFTEVLQLTLTSPRLASLAGGGVRVRNPVQEEYSVLRPSLLPGLIAVARANLHRDKPVKVFEIGLVAKPAGGGIVDELMLGLMVMDYEASYEDIQAPLYSVLRLLGISFTVEPAEHGLLMPGRAARILAGDTVLGVLGEVRPEVLEEVGVDYPLVVAEVSVDKLARLAPG
ncbi:MAG: phenylalanine--tRNA ligase subunit beta [Desulfurococcales archaeon]|nr:phenylalanine--tRNA ligase subunit beta [Desulfurococcales archaeon]